MAGIFNAGIFNNAIFNTGEAAAATASGGGVDLRYGDKDYGWKLYLEQLERERERELQRKIEEIAPLKVKIQVKKDFAKTEEYKLLSEHEQTLIAELILMAQLEYEMKLKLAWEQYIQDESLAILLLSIH